jgi:hypothetical protein
MFRPQSIQVIGAMGLELHPKDERYTSQTSVLKDVKGAKAII